MKKISCFFLFRLLIVLSTWRMHFVGDKNLSQHLPVLPGRKHDTGLIASLDGTIHLVEGNSWKVRWSFSSGPALCSSYQTLRWGKDDTKSLINGDYSIECGDDWNLYVRKRTLDKVEPIGTMSKYVNSAPHYLKGMIVLGHREVIIFKVDARTGRVKSAVTDANEQYLIKKDVGESTNMPANELLITRTNYMLHCYFRDTLEPAWNMTVGYIKFTHHCLNFGKTYNGDDMAFPCGAKGVVHRSHGHNPLHFAVKSLDSRNEDEVIFLLHQHSSSSTLNMSPDQLEKGANDYNLKFLGGSSFLIVGLLSMLRKIIAGLLGYQWQKNHVHPNRQPSGLNEKRKGKKRNNGSTIQGNLQLEDDGEFPASSHERDAKYENNGSTIQGHLQLEDEEEFPALSLARVAKNENNRSTIQGHLQLEGEKKFPVLLLERDAENENNGSTIQGHLQLEDEEELPFLSLDTESLRFSDHLLKELQQGKMLIQELFNKFKGERDEEEFEKLLLRGYKRRHPEFLTTDCNEGNGCFIGKIFVSKREIARGRNGTIIFEGIYSNKVHVAVKRVVHRRSPVNLYNLGSLIDLVQHPNIVHVIDIGMGNIFNYFALERCDYNLYELIQLCNLNRGNACDNSVTQIDKMLWQPNGYLSPVSVKLIRDVVSGLAHLHNKRFRNRDLKPQRVLINLGAFPHAKICDQGIIEGHVAHHRSPGWHSPKTLLGGPQLCRRKGLMPSPGPAQDLFNLGCLIFYFITKGHHPFGLVRMRDTNIERNCPDLALVKHHYEAAHLISNLLHPQPEMRPAASKVLYHPFFWDSERCGHFLQDVSDWLLVRDGSNMNDVFNEMMDAAPKVLGGNWDVKMEALLLTYSACQACYRYDNFFHLLLFIGNTLSAQELLPKDIQELIGSTHGEIYDYFASQFPKLLIVVYDVLSNYCEENIDQLSVYGALSNYCKENINNSKKGVILKYFGW